MVLFKAVLQENLSSNYARNIHSSITLHNEVSQNIYFWTILMMLWIFKTQDFKRQF